MNAPRAGVWCPNEQPHLPHQYAVRAGGITYAGGLCPGRCSCGNWFDGGNLCMVSACEREA